MSILLDTPVQLGPRPSTEFLLRAFVLDDVETDGRTVTLRAVPYGVTASVRDRRTDGTLTPAYREGWRQGAFEGLARAAHRVPLIVGDHEQRRTNPFADVGKGVQFLERADGLIATFRVDATPFGEAALAKVNDGQWAHCSIGARPRRYVDEGDPFAGGVRWRTRAHLDHVLLTDTPAYADAEVLAVRSDTPRFDRYAAKYLARC